MTRTIAFNTWADVIAHVRAGKPIWYLAPMDRSPVRVTIARVYKNGKLRVIPPTRDADPFTADRAHLSRFRRALEYRGHEIRETTPAGNYYTPAIGYATPAATVETLEKWIDRAIAAGEIREEK